MNAESYAHAIRELIESAFAEGYLLQGWPDSYDGDATMVDLMFIKNKRGDDGIMRNIERAKIDTVYL